MKATWDDLLAWQQASLLGYDQVRQFEEAEEFQILATRSM